MTTTQTAQPGVEAEIRTPRLTREQLLASYAEAGFSRAESAAFLDWMVSTVIPACRSDHQHYFVTERDIDEHYDVLDGVMSHGNVAEPGSLHAQTEAHLLDPSRGEVGLLHDMRRNGRIEYCSITVDVVEVT